MDIDELMRAARPGTSAGWSRSQAGQRVLDEVITASPACSGSGQARRTASRPARRLLLAAALPAVAVVTAGAIFLTVSGSDPAPHADGPAAESNYPAAQPTPSASPTRAATVLTARQLLLAAAEQSAAHPATSGRYWVLRRESGAPVKVGPPDRPYYINTKMIMEYWSATGLRDKSLRLGQLQAGAAPVTDADRAAWEADGSPTSWTVPGPPGTEPTVYTTVPGPWLIRPNTGDRPSSKNGIEYYLAGSTYTLQQLAQLPTEPRQLAKRLNILLAANNVHIVNNHSLFEAVKRLVADLPVTPQVRAAAYRLLAEVKGTEALGEVRDQHGRTGVAIGFVRRDDFNRWYQTRLIIDATTGQALAEETWDLGSRAKPAKTGTLRTFTVIVRAEFTDDSLPADRGR